jgi:hypothetical protein
MHRLLREYIRLSVLNEDDGGGFGDTGGLSDFAASDSPFGMSFGSQDTLMKVFVEPFTDVFKVASGKSKEISQKVQTLGKVAFEATMTTLIPTLSDDFQQIFAKEEQQIGKIKQDYKAVYDATWESLFDNDVQVLAMMYSPAAYLTANFFRKAPGAACDLIGVLTGGRIDTWLGKIKAKFNIGTSTGKGSGASSSYDEGVVYPNTNNLVEADPPVQQPGEKDISAMLADDKVKNVVANSQMTRQMQATAQKLVQGTLTAAYNEARSVLQAKSLQDLQRVVKKQIDVSKLQQIPQEQRQAAETALMTATKKSMKEFFVKNLQAQVDSAVKAGVPAQAPYVLAYNKVIDRIKSL